MRVCFQRQSHLSPRHPVMQAGLLPEQTAEYFFEIDVRRFTSGSTIKHDGKYSDLRVRFTFHAKEGGRHEANKFNLRNLFMNNPQQYLPQFGGFCAFGAAVGKKLYADPTVWKLVDGKLYLNVDSKIQKKFERNLTANIAKAETNWPKLVDRTPEGL